MDDKNTPGSHPDPWVEFLGGYVTGAVQALNAAGLQVQRSWLDPCDPRDATIVLADGQALVYDEVDGWRRGRFIAGRQGLRTKLAEVSYVGGGVLPDSKKLVYRIVNGHSSPCHEYRRVTDVRDGFDDALRGYGRVV